MKYLKTIGIIVIIFELIAIITVYGINKSTQVAWQKADSLSENSTDTIRSILDENLIKYNGKCWNSLSGTDENDCGNSLIKAGTHYALKSNDDGEYYLEETGAGDDLFDASYNVEEDLYRNVYVEYGTTVDAVSANSMMVIVTVGWISHGEKLTVKSQNLLYNYNFFK